MNHVLVICSKENEAKIIRKFLKKTPYTYENAVYQTEEQRITVVEPYTKLSEKMYHSVIFDDSAGKLDVAYLAHIRDVLIDPYP